MRHLGPEEGEVWIGVCPLHHNRNSLESGEWHFYCNFKDHWYNGEQRICQPRRSEIRAGDPVKVSGGSAPTNPHQHAQWFCEE